MHGLKTTMAHWDYVVVVLCAAVLGFTAMDAYAGAGDHCPATINWTTGQVSCSGATATVAAVQRWGWNGNQYVQLPDPPYQNQPAKGCACHVLVVEGETTILKVYFGQTCCNAVLFGNGYGMIGTIGACVQGCPTPSGTCTLTGTLQAAEAECQSS